MATPAIQTLLTDAQQVLNLNSLSEVRATMAAALANANVGTPLNPNLTTQQLWNQFYLIVRQPESDIESIITNQLMKFLFAPPAPGGVGGNQQVIYNDNGVLAGDPKFLWDPALNKLDIDGSATITGALTVGTGANAAVLKASFLGGYSVFENSAGTGNPSITFNNDLDTGIRAPAANTLVFDAGGFEQYRIASSGVFTWSDGAGGTRMTLNSTGLGVGGSPTHSLTVRSSAAAIGMFHSTNVNGPYIIFQNSTANFGDIGSELGITGGGSAGNLTLNSRSTSNLCFAVNDSVKMRIDSTGNVGIGVTPATAIANNRKLEIVGTINSAVVLGTNSANASARNWATASNWNAYGDLAFLQSNALGGDPLASGAGTTRMSLDASGRLLVGSTSAFTDLTGSKEVKIGDGGIQTFSSAITAATATSIARSGFGGMVSVTASNGTGQYSAVVIFTSASATVVSVINGTGSTITFGVASGYLQITSSAALTNCIAQSFRNN